MTPLSIVIDEEGLLMLRAEDATGGFGILPQHEDLITSLTVGVVSWQSRDAKRCYCAVRQGILSVTQGETIAISTREAVLSDDLATLDETVLAQFRADLELERTEHVATARLQLNAVRQIVRCFGLRGGIDAQGFA